MRTTLLTIALALISFCVWAATPSSGTVSQVGDSQSWSGDPFTAASLSPGTCVESVSCDTFTLTVIIPSNKLAQIHFRIEWADAANDLDLFLFDSEGNQIDSSTSGDQKFEEIRPAIAAGTYRVVTNAFLSGAITESGG